MPNAGRAGSDWMMEQLSSRGITSRVAAKVARVEDRLVVFEDGSEQHFDLLIAVLPHHVPEVVSESGLAGPHGWIAVDSGTLETTHPRVYAVGDVTLIPLANRDARTNRHDRRSQRRTRRREGRRSSSSTSHAGLASEQR
jgi:sulfide:quinone oxidoreductase